MEQENKWKSIEEVEKTLNIEKVDLNFGFDDKKQPIVKVFEIFDGDVKVKYTPIKYEQIRKTIQGFDGYEDVKRPIFLSEVDEFFPLYRELKERTEKGEKIKCHALVKRMELKTGEVYFSMRFDGIANLKIEESV